MTSRLEAFGKPVIAAVNGLAFGGGCEITQAAHLAVASERAAFGEPEIRLGMMPTFGGSQPNLTIGEGLQMESEQFARLVATHDLQEGLAAWRECRQPIFKGR